MLMFVAPVLDDNAEVDHIAFCPGCVTDYLGDTMCLQEVSQLIVAVTATSAVCKAVCISND